VTAHRIEGCTSRGRQGRGHHSNKSYDNEPEQAGVRAYALFRDALEESGKVAVAKVA